MELTITQSSTNLSWFQVIEETTLSAPSQLSKDELTLVRDIARCFRNLHPCEPSHKDGIIPFIPPVTGGPVTGGAAASPVQSSQSTNPRAVYIDLSSLLGNRATVVGRALQWWDRILQPSPHVEQEVASLRSSSQEVTTLSPHIVEEEAILVRDALQWFASLVSTMQISQGALENACLKKADHAAEKRISCTSTASVLAQLRLEDTGEEAATSISTDGLGAELSAIAHVSTLASVRTAYNALIAAPRL